MPECAGREGCNLGEGVEEGRKEGKQRREQLPGRGEGTKTPEKGGRRGRKGPLVLRPGAGGRGGGGVAGSCGWRPNLPYKAG